jgi:LCP family protein required for cell wall assembly
VEVYPGETWDGKGPIFILFIGSDTRDHGAGTCPDANVTRGNADGIHIVGINPVTKAGTIINIPRDTWARIPGHGSAKINAAFSWGGPKLLAQTVANYTGIPIHYTIITTMCGLIKLVDASGGIWVDVPRTFQDKDARWGAYGCSGREIQAGRQLLNGCDTLTFARSRKAQPRGDFDRTNNQGTILLGLLERFKELSGTPKGFWDVLGMWQAVTGAKKLNDVRVLVDFNMSRTELLQLANLARAIGPGGFTNVDPRQLNATTGWVGKASVVFLKGDRVFRDVADDAMLNGSR